MVEKKLVDKAFFGVVAVLLITGGSVVGAHDDTTVDLGRGQLSVFVPDS